MTIRAFVFFILLFILLIPTQCVFAQHVSWSIGENSKDGKGKSVRKDYKNNIDSLRAILKTTTDSLQKRKIRTALHGELKSEAKYNYDSAHYEESALLYEEAFDINPGKGLRSIGVNDLLYNAGCSWALFGDKEKAFRDIEKAIDNGWSDVNLLKTDKDLVNLRSEKAWFALLAKFQATEKIHTYLKGIFFGILFILFLNYMFLFFSVKDTSLLYYSLFLLFGALTQINTIPESGEYLFNLVPGFKTLLAKVDSTVFYSVMMMLFYLLFARKFLDLKEKFRKKDKWMKFFIAYSIINILLSLRGSGWSVAGTAYLFTFIISLTCLKRGNKQVKYFVLANSIYCMAYLVALTIAIVNFVKSGQNSFNDFTLVPDLIGLVASATLLSFVMGNKINALKTETIMAQEKALVVLEERVVERTAEVVKEKNEVIRQKILVEEKQHEIVDSITYAQRLQQAILPPLSEIKLHFPESFVLYLPKDIVAGDFYWMYATEDSVFIAAADCTGHGVPGALVSIVCSNALNRAVKEFGCMDTGKILDKVSELVMETFEKSGEEINDGMDISLLRVQKNISQSSILMQSDLSPKGASQKVKNRQSAEDESIEVQWSGANNPLWIIKDNVLTEIKANKQPIGKSKERKLFTSHLVQVEKGETIFLITDGYADQFSEEDKKLMKRRFKELLLSVQDKPMPEQKQLLEDHHTKWKARAEQTDDVTVIGLKL